MDYIRVDTDGQLTLGRVILPSDFSGENPPFDYDDAQMWH